MHDQVYPAGALIVVELHSESAVVNLSFFRRDRGLLLVPPVGGNKNAVSFLSRHFVQSVATEANRKVDGRTQWRVRFSRFKWLATADDSALIPAYKVVGHFSRDGADQLIVVHSVQDTCRVAFQDIHVDRCEVEDLLRHVWLVYV